MLDWGHKKLWVVLTRELEVLAILKGEGTQSCPPLKGVAKHFTLY